MKVGHADPYAKGEVCPHCDQLASHKITEDNVSGMRHGFSQYVCCEWFGKIMGRRARNWCEENA